MIRNTFQAEEVVLGKLFDNDYLFRMPFYQRPYSWTTEEAGELLTDLLNAMNDSSDDEPYFLGSVVLIARPDSAIHEVIDGQQRLTTLTILFCVLRELTDDSDKRASLDSRVREKRDVFAGRQDRFRLELRDRDRDFFRDNVQLPGRISNFISENSFLTSDSQKLIRANTKFLLDELVKLSQRDRDRLSQFVIARCYLVIVTAYDRDSAHRIFSVLNARGLDLTPTDILKSDVIGDIPGRFQDTYTRIWEDIEDDLGREGLRELFAHIFVILTGNRFHKELAKAFKTEVLDDPDVPSRTGADFIDGVLTRYAESFKVVANATYESASRAEEINRLLAGLGRIDNEDWIPVAMVFHDRYKNDPARLLDLLNHLDRLAYAMFIVGVRRDPRILRYRPVISALGEDVPSDFDDAVAHLQLTDQEKGDAVAALNGPVYRSQAARYTRPLLLRLDTMLSDAGATYDHKVITVEHVLPQSPDPDSVWLKNFPYEDERQDWTHRLANLVLLSRSKNASAQNYDFDRKKKEYFQKNGVTPFALTTQVVNESEWTPSVLKQRQEDLMDVFKTNWALN